MFIQTIDYEDGSRLLEGYLAYHDTGKVKPAVLIAHDWSGRREFACKAAEKIADMGYVGFALDMYGKGIFGADGDTEKNGALMSPFAKDRALLRRRIDVALHTIRQLPQVDGSKIHAAEDAGGEATSLDERTWRDLNLDDVYAVLDRTTSTVGQQRLYHRRRSRASVTQVAAFEALVTAVSDVAIRERCQVALSRLASSAGYALHRLAQSGAIHLHWWHYASPFVALLMLASVARYLWVGTLPGVTPLLVPVCFVLWALNTRRMGGVIEPFRMLGPLLRGCGYYPLCRAHQSLRQHGSALGGCRGARPPDIIGTMLEEVDRLTLLTTLLLELTRAEGGQAAMKCEAIDLRELVRDAAGFVGVPAEEERVRIDLDLPATVVPVTGDWMMLRQAIVNLLDNAIKHSPPGATATLASQAQGEQMEISVSDQGEGISAEQLPHVFDRFYRVDAARSRQNETVRSGFGLGLAIARWAVGAHGGHIAAESTPGKGSVFRIALPRERTLLHPEGTTS